jgi:hypothetical protein
MPGIESEVYVTKIAAAQRQIDAAIRMSLASEDDLAIHTVIAAAYSIIRDLKSKRGRGEITDQVARGCYAFAHDLVLGHITALPPEVQSMAKIIHHIADQIRSGQVKNASDVTLTPDWSFEKRHRMTENKPANFLKHADLDAGAKLLRTELANDLLIVKAIVGYEYLMHTRTPEMLVFGQLWFAGTDDGPGQTPNELVLRLRSADQMERSRICLQTIEELKTENTN